MRPSLPSFQAIILDMDGLVLDSEPSYAFAWRQAAAAFGVELSEEVVSAWFGLEAREIERRLQASLGAVYDSSRYWNLAKAYWQEYLTAHGVASMPGVGELLGELGRLGIPYAMATNSEGRYARHCLRLAGLENRFPLLVTREQVARGKPEPDLILEAVRLLGVPVEHCLVLEDSCTGLLACQRAGAIPIRVFSGPVSEVEVMVSAIRFESLHGLAQVLRAFSSLDEVIGDKSSKNP